MAAAILGFGFSLKKFLSIRPKQTYAKIPVHTNATTTICLGSSVESAPKHHPSHSSSNGSIHYTGIDVNKTYCLDDAKPGACDGTGGLLMFDCPAGFVQLGPCLRLYRFKPSKSIGMTKCVSCSRIPLLRRVPDSLINALTWIKPLLGTYTMRSPGVLLQFLIQTWRHTNGNTMRLLTSYIFRRTE